LIEVLLFRAKARVALFVGCHKVEFSAGSVLTAGAAFVTLAWVAGRTVRRRRADKRFGSIVSGGRSGRITIRCKGSAACAEYEVGTRNDFVVYRSSFAWANGAPFAAEDCGKLVATLEAWSAARGSKLEVANDTQ
jgi:hypothetical protein